MTKVRVIISRSKAIVTRVEVFNIAKTIYEIYSQG
jgi:hypothetical protein